MKKRKYYFMLFLVFLVIVFVAFQLFLYWYEGGVRVADRYHSTPISDVIYFKMKPLSEAVVANREISTRDSEGRRINRIEPYMNWFRKWSYWNALRKFPTLEHCLHANARQTGDVSQFNWKSLRTSTQVEVCLYHLSFKLGTIEAIEEWAKSQNFETSLATTRASSFRESLRVIQARWNKKDSDSNTPYPFFSIQTLLVQYGLDFVIFRRIGTPRWEVWMNKDQKVVEIKVSSKAAK